MKVAQYIGNNIAYAVNNVHLFFVLLIKLMNYCSLTLVPAGLLLHLITSAEMSIPSIRTIYG